MTGAHFKEQIGDTELGPHALAHTSLCEMAFRTGVRSGMDTGCSWWTVWEGEEHEQRSVQRSQKNVQTVVF